MSLSLAESFSNPTNPLDQIEDILVAKEWYYDRPAEDEIHVDVTGRWTDYRLHFLWREELSVLHFTSIFDIKVPETRKQVVYELLSKINEKLWFGHFTFLEDQSLPCYRHSLPFRGVMRISSEQIEDLVEIALDECERFYPAFQMVVWGGKTSSEALEVSLFETQGEA